jgi:iron complex outermembrane recepter protein
MSKKPLLRTASALALFAVAADPTFALAQQFGALEEIVVTARKREEKLQDIPITVTAFTSDSISKLGIRNPFDLAAMTPGLTYENIGFRSGEKATIRGLTTPSTVASQQKASVFIDGIYVAGAYSSQALTNLERVEVLKGPQSAFFGRSTFAGAINYVTQDPTDEVSGRVSAQAATLGETEISGTVGGPLVGDKLLGQVTAYYFDFNGPDYWTNVPDGHKNGSQKTKNGSAKLIFNASDDVRITLRTAYNDDKDGHLTAVFLDPALRNGRFTKPTGQVAFYPVGAINVTKPVFNYSFGRFSQPGIDRFSNRSNIQLDTSVGGHDVTVQAAHNYEHSKVQSDLDLTSLGAQRSYTDVRTKDDAVEVRVASPQDQRFRYLAGFYYLDLELRNNNRFFLDTIGSFTPTVSTETAKNTSGFGGLYFDITDQLTATIEGRYQRDKISAVNQITNAAFDATFNTFLPRFNLEFKATDSVLFYAVVSKGNNPGGFNTGIIAAANQRTFDEEKLWNYEGGIKSTWLDGALLLNASAYHLKWTNQQFRRSFTTPTGTLATVTVNEGDSKVDGFELESVIAPVPGFDMRGTVSYNRAKYTNFCSANLAALLGRTDLPAPDFCLFVNGNTLEAQPAWQGSLSAGYAGDLGADWSWFARSDLQVTGKKYESEMNLAWSPTAKVINARIGVENKMVTLEAYARNLFHEDSPVRVARLSDLRVPGGRNFDQNTAFVPRTPRQLGVRATTKF